MTEVDLPARFHLYRDLAFRMGGARARMSSPLRARMISSAPSGRVRGNEPLPQFFRRLHGHNFGYLTRYNFVLHYYIFINRRFFLT